MHPRLSTQCSINLCRSSRSVKSAYRWSSTLPPLINIRDVPAPHQGHIRILSLHNPTSRNAISRAMLADLAHQVEAIHTEGVGGHTRALIIASSVNEAFCAGADLKERRGFTTEETTHFLHTLRNTLRSISQLPIPSISAIASLALGGGLELALSTHLRIIGSSALVGLPESRLAIVPGAGGTYRLPALVGRARALEMMLTGRRVGGKEAHAWGLAERLVDVGDDAGQAREEVLRAAVGLAVEICEGGPLATRALVRCVGRGEEEENRAYEQVMGTADRDEALNAFREKRKARFTGT